jgi:putative copper resistance protein D
MMIDWISALVRALSFVALFQAAGVAIAVAVFGRCLVSSSRRVRAVGVASAAGGALLVAAHYALEAGRMAGSLEGVFDRSLQQMVFESPVSSAAGLRVLGLIVIAALLLRAGRAAALMGLLGVICLALAFTFVGHTADESRTSWLAVLLVLHLIVVAFWFGGLVPLYIVAGRESAEHAVRIVAIFSRIASIAVPGLFVVGLGMTVLLVGRWSVFSEPYGLLLFGKIAGFAALMGFAALNKWKYGPAIARGGQAIATFRRMLVIEYVLICAVLTATAVMTTFYSPHGE